MLQITCTGIPHTIGYTHGTLASPLLSRSLTFYTSLFEKKCSMSWPLVRSFAMKFHLFLSANFPEYVEEMKGVAEGAGVEYEDILALNVRTEIAFGNFSDGCTALSWKYEGKKGDGGRGGVSLLAQNWDWDILQSENLINLKIHRPSGLSIQMITEAGIIGKIGLNSLGVGCTLNAITAKGTSFSRLPTHLALRTVLESSSRQEAIERLEKEGIASSCHILVADATGGTGLEYSAEDIVRLEMDERGLVVHTNHFILKHKESVKEKDFKEWIADSGFRLERTKKLLGERKEEESCQDVVLRIMVDETEGDGAAICRTPNEHDRRASLFGILMDLEGKKVRIMVGRPANPSEEFVLSF